MTFPKIPLTVPPVASPLPPPPAPMAAQASAPLPVPSALTPAPAAPAIKMPPMQPPPAKMPDKPAPAEGISIDSAKRAQGIYVAEGQKKLRDKERPIQKAPTESRWGKA